MPVDGVELENRVNTRTQRKRQTKKSAPGPTWRRRRGLTRSGATGRAFITIDQRIQPRQNRIHDRSFLLRRRPVPAVIQVRLEPLHEILQVRQVLRVDLRRRHLAHVEGDEDGQAEDDAAVEGGKAAAVGLRLKGPGEGGGASVSDLTART